jgi:hypothetical protein
MQAGGRASKCRGDSDGDGSDSVTVDWAGGRTAGGKDILQRELSAPLRCELRLRDLCGAAENAHKEALGRGNAS